MKAVLLFLQGGVRTWDVMLRAVRAAVGRDRQTTLPAGTADTCLVLWVKLISHVEHPVPEASPADRDSGGRGECQTLGLNRP